MLSELIRNFSKTYTCAVAFIPFCRLGSTPCKLFSNIKYFSAHHYTILHVQRFLCRANRLSMQPTGINYVFLWVWSFPHNIMINRNIL